LQVIGDRPGVTVAELAAGPASPENVVYSLTRTLTQHGQRFLCNARILPVPMRLENSEKDKLERRKAYARRLFGGFPTHQVDKQGYWPNVEVLYVPFY
jgi:hypothetical protein